ncbi:unnamed protein product [Rangifer tarandus platyrhynchus]|uniref:Uncharacterized protein n=2 Tax=Rangifer tarandus platyrhynchus TaxID=3082113 RepID=A0ABN8Y603_RANTA|nr:unnamed protein product [Rangifer tarandus platyrhynchus]CAI9692850.1 unnamed protein product [Rangifer tarandus platyrhynchus]
MNSTHFNTFWKVQTIETTDGARDGPPKQTFGASESAYLAGIPSPSGKETDTRKVLRTRDERPREGALAEGVPGGAPTRAPSSPGPRSGLPPTPGALRGRGPERRPESVRATRPASPVEPRPRPGGSCRSRPGCSAAARSFGVVRDRGAALPPQLGHRPRLTSAALPCAARAGHRAPGTAGRRSRGPRGTGAGPPGPPGGRARDREGRGVRDARQLGAELAAARSQSSGRAPAARAGERGRELGASCRGRERVSPPVCTPPSAPPPAPPLPQPPF